MNWITKKYNKKPKKGIVCQEFILDKRPLSFRNLLRINAYFSKKSTP